jgi:AraC-like DNA-binding protein
MAMKGTLSEFLNLLDLRGQTWCFVDIRASGGFSIPRNESVLFYAVMHGAVRIEGVSGGAIDLRRGNVAMILSGDGHRVTSGGDAAIRPLDFLCDDRNVDEPPVIASGTSGKTNARVLCARLKVTWPKGLRRVSMPPVVTIGMDRNNFSSFTEVRSETLQVASAGSGAAALLTRLAALMLTVSLRNHPQCQLLFRSSEWSDPIAHALHLIGSEPSAEWSVAVMAKKVGMGRSSFAARFAEQVGRTPMEVITEQRMRHAADLLWQSDLKLIEISERAGYRSEAAFSRRFTRYFGTSPSAMRRQARSGRDAEPGPSGVHALVANPE